MGQSPSLPRQTPPNHPTRSLSYTTRVTVDATFPDATSSLPDEILALIFQSLPQDSLNNCSLVCKRWFLVEGQNRHRLSLTATSQIFPILPSLFSRFDSVTKLALRCDRRSISLSDDALLLISINCRNLTRRKLRGCRELTDVGIAAFADNCRSLRKLSCGSCVFGVDGVNSVLRYCKSIEEISIKRLRGINHEFDVDETSNSSVIALSLKSICLKELYNGQLFAPMIIGAKNLKTLKLIRCLGDWDNVLETLVKNNECKLTELHLERIQVSDVGLKAVSSCVSLETLHLVKTPECTNLGVVSVSERCKLLRKVHIDGWRTNRIGDEGLSALGKNCVNLQELVLIGVNPTTLSIGVIASNCKGLERLALCGSETIGDVELSCIASRCLGLKKFCIKSCPISDNGLEAIGWGCPNLVKMKVKKCKDVTTEIVEWLSVKRKSLIVELNVDKIERTYVDASVIEASVGLEDGVEGVGEENEVTPGVGNVRGIGRGSVFRVNFNVFFRRNVAGCALRRWSGGGGDNAGASQ